MENILAEKLQNYITNLLGGQVSIASADGEVITSSEKKQIGTIVDLNTIQGSNYLSGSSSDLSNPSLIGVALYYESEIQGYVLVNDESHKFFPQMTLIKSLAELLIQQYYESIKPDLDSTDKFICSLLYNKDLNNLEYLSSQARILGYRLDIPRMAFIVHLDGFWKNYLNNNIEFSDEKENIILRKKHDLEKTISSFFTKDTENISAYMGEDKFVLFKDVKSTPEGKVVQLLKDNFKNIIAPMVNFNISRVSAGIGRSRSGTIGLVKSCKEADEALNLGRKMWGDNQVYSYDELGLLSIIGQGAKDKKLFFSNQVLSRLADPDLVKTLQYFFDQNLNLTQTSEKLGIHRNTVIYRLDQIAKTINKDPRNFDQAVEIKMALLVDKLLK
ncbi:MAG: helix-turn-helix domain-containing protein [bacterium]|nr:helix-turn-helix domain-containing protein [bacterium]